MKTLSRRTKLLAVAIAMIALTAIWATWGAGRVRAVMDVEIMPSPFGLARGQTARLTILNSGETLGFVINWKFLDSEGRTLARSPEQEAIPTDQFRSFDISADSLETADDRFGRIQMRAVVTVIGSTDVSNLRVSVEVFDNATGRTSIFCTNPSNDK